MVTKVRGEFTEFSGTAHIDTADPAARRSPHHRRRLDQHRQQGPRRPPGLAGLLRRRDLPRTSPSSRPRSTRDGDDWTITGDLTIKDTTKPVTIVFEHTGSAQDPFGNVRVGFEGDVTVSRKDWGLTWNAALETGGVLVSDKVKLEFDISAISNA